MKLKIFDRYFQSYAEYCLRTTFTEEKLQEVLKKECPSTSHLLSWKAVKAAIGLSKTIVFARAPDDPLQLRPLRMSRNTSRGELFIKCEKLSETATVLHISIAQPPSHKWLLYGIFIFAALWGVAAMSVVWWMIFFPLPFAGALFFVLEGCKAMAEDEVPRTRREFENMLRALEEKYRSGS